jgi:hypothetical protein
MTPDPASDHRVGLAVRDPDPDLFSIGQRQRTWASNAVS